MAAKAAVEEAKAPSKAKAPSLEDRIAELEGDLVRVVDLLIKGDLDSSKFKAIVEKRQGKAKLGA